MAIRYFPLETVPLEIFNGSFMPHLSAGDLIHLSESNKKIQTWVNSEKGPWKALLQREFFHFGMFQDPKQTYIERYFSRWNMTHGFHLIQKLVYPVQNLPTNENRVYIWNLDRKNSMKTIELRDARLSCLATSSYFAHNYGLIAVGLKGGETYIHNMNSEQFGIIAHSQEMEVLALAFSEDNHKLAIGYPDQIQIWDLPEDVSGVLKCSATFSENFSVKAQKLQLSLTLVDGKIFSSSNQFNGIRVRSLFNLDSPASLKERQDNAHLFVVGGHLGSKSRDANETLIWNPKTFKIDSSSNEKIYEWHEYNFEQNAGQIFEHKPNRVLFSNYLLNFDVSQIDMLFILAGLDAIDADMEAVFDDFSHLQKRIRSGVFERLHGLIQHRYPNEPKGFEENAFFNLEEMGPTCTYAERVHAMAQFAMKELFFGFKYTQADIICVLSSLYALLKYVVNKADGQQQTFLMRKCRTYFSQLPQKIHDALQCKMTEIAKEDGRKFNSFNVFEIMLNAILKFLGDDLNPYCPFARLLDKKPELVLSCLGYDGNRN